MRIDLTVCGPDGVGRDVAVLADEPVPFSGVRAAIDPSGTVPGWCSGARPVAGTDLLGGPGLRCGDRLTVTPHAAEPAVRGIDVVGGIDAGNSLRGARRTVLIGRDTDCDLRLRDPDVSRRHAQLSFTARGILVRDLGSTHGTHLAATPVVGLRRWQPTDWLRVGDTHLARSCVRSGPAAVHPDASGSLVVRPNHRGEPPQPVVIELPAPAATGVRTASGWTAILMPSVAGVGMAVWTGSVAFLAIALLSPLLLAGTVIGQRIAERRRERRLRSADAASAARSGEQIEAALRDETTARRLAYPDAATVSAVARAPLDRLWERARGAPDLHRVRLGLTDAPSDVRIDSGSSCRPAGTVSSVPAVVDLADGPLGLVGPMEAVRGLARWLVVQLAVFASPADLRIAVRTDDVAGWHWARWLPHLQPGRQAGVPTVLVHDQCSTGEAVRTPAICLADCVAELPAGCTQIVSVQNEAGTRLRVGGRTVLTDAVTEQWAEQIARALAPLLPAAAGGPPEPPRACRLGDVLGPPEPVAITRSWDRGSAAATATIGLGPSGPVELDLDRHGPHVLVAGTTGAGKSELLRTLVIALAAEQPPNEISFVLVDYKGGSAFAECAALPHVTGLVTDLDEHLTARALASLGAELRRREALFAAADVSDLAAYKALAHAPPLPRLVIVVDELATLAAELPDFVAGLTAVAQRGRSLGLHLVLATQRPAGVVTADVRANCATRIALRVTDAADSRDVIEVPDAATVPHDLPGRAYVWIDGRTTPVQIARTDTPVASSRRVEVRPLGPWRRLDAPESTGREPTELSAFATAITAAAKSRGLSPAASPWLPPLAKLVPLDATPRHTGTNIAIGLVDLPRRQLQQALAVDLDAGSSLLLVGAPRSGRTTGLFSIATAAARRYPPDTLHVHALDMRGDLAARLAELPHRGTLVGPAEGIELADALLRELDRGGARARTVLLVDDWEGLARASADWDGGGTVERLLSMIRAGTRGRTIALAGDRTALAPRLSGAVTTRLLLRMPDRSDYALAGIPLAAVPTRMPPGRVLIAPDGVEAQLAYADPAEISTLDIAPRTCTAVRLRPLPGRMALADLPPPDGVLPFAVAAPYGRSVGVPLASIRLLITGPPRSGKSTALATLLHQAVRAGLPVTVVAGVRSPLRAVAANLGIATLGPGDAATCTGAVLVDDAAELTDSPLDEELAQRARSTCGHPLVVTARTEDAVRAYRGVIAEMRRNRCALLLQPGPQDGELVGLHLGRGSAGGPPGRGVLVGDPCWGEHYAAGPLRVQVAVVS